MYALSQTNKFKKGIKTTKKRGLKMELFDETVTLLVESGKLPSKYKPHLLKGNYPRSVGMPYPTGLAPHLETG
jgi:mRNA interferase YafQ